MARRLDAARTSSFEGSLANRTLFPLTNQVARG
jgi:hypothetical protein